MIPVGTRIRSKFRIGDDRLGTIVGYNPSRTFYAIRFDEKSTNHHQCDGLTEPQHGYWLMDYQFEVIPRTPKDVPIATLKEELEVLWSTLL